MLNKKIMSLSIAGLLVVSMVGCNSTVEESQSVEGKANVVEEQVKEEAKNDMSLVLVDNEVVNITITEKFEDGDESYKQIGYKATVVNKSDKNLLIGINDASVNGVMNDPAWATTVMAGKTSYETIYWWTGEDSEEFNPNVFSIEDLVNVEFTITVSDDDTWDRLTEASVVIE